MQQIWQQINTRKRMAGHKEMRRSLFGFEVLADRASLFDCSNNSFDNSLENAILSGSPNPARHTQLKI